MERNIKAMIDLGLSEQEARTYLTLLKLGGSQASRVAKVMGIKRTTVYALLKNLAAKGFVTLYFRKNKQFYYADKPQRISRFYEKKIDTFNTLIPYLESIEKKEAERLGLRFIETKPELEQFYKQILVEYKNRSYRIIGSQPAWEGIDPEFFKNYRWDRGHAKIKTRLLLSADSKPTNPTDPRLLRNFRYLPKKYIFKSTIDIYDDKILIVSPELTSLAVVIAVPAMVDVFKSVFEILWGHTSREAASMLFKK